MNSNSAIMEQHARWAASRARLMGRTPVRGNIRALIVPLLPEHVQEPPEPLERDWLMIEASPEPDSPTPPPSPMMPRWKIILREVANKHKLNVTDLLSTRRPRNIVAARHEAMYRMKTETSLSLPSIGKRLGGLDHTTVIHGLRRYELLRAEAALQ